MKKTLFVNVAVTDSLGISSLYPHNRYSICGDGSFSYASQTTRLEPPPQRPQRVAVRLVCPPLLLPSTRAPGRQSITVTWVGGSLRIRHLLLRIGLGSPGWFQATKW